MLGFPWYSSSQVEVLCLLVEVLLSSSGESTALIEVIACGFVREESRQVVPVEMDALSLPSLASFSGIVVRSMS